MDDAETLGDRLIAARATAGLMLVGLDFDGTLAPIVPHPDDAALPAATRTVVAALARRADTRVALVSGRALADLRRRVDVADAYYAGNHGLEICGPGVQRLHPGAADARTLLTEVARDLADELAGVDGVVVEDKGLTLSVHYRRVEDDADRARVRQHVIDRCQGVTGIRVTEGKKVVEVRPAVDWHKGRALRFLRETLLAAHPGAPALFIGDDRTDEDAFREVGDGGGAIFVGQPAAGTAAHAALPGVPEVVRFLQRLL